MKTIIQYVRWLNAVCLLLAFPLFAKESYDVIEDQAKLPLLDPTFAEQKKIKIRLKNGLEALIISDPRTDQSYAALSVNVGSWEDPEQYPGMAHFLEHMLFLGTKEYPNESEYQRFISEHDGATNAFTTNDHTAYLFSVNNDAFKEALKRFSSFFKEPLFNPSGVARELQAIDQEFAKNYENDDIREMQVLKELGNPKHPNHRFSIGNSQTLKSISQQALKEWYKEHYSANLMRLVVVSNLPLEESIDLVISDFSQVPNYNYTFQESDQSILDEKFNKKIVYVQPIQNTRTLTIVWELPSEFGQMQDSRPEFLIGHLLGHEGEGSLFAQLKAEQFAESIRSGAVRLGGNQLHLYLELSLTDKGLEHLNQVIAQIFQALAVYRQAGVPSYVFEEVHNIGKVQYQYQPREEAFARAMKDALRLGEESFATFPEQSMYVQKYRPENMQKLLNLLTLDRALFFVRAPFNLLDLKPTAEEKWMAVPYTVRDISQEQWKLWSQAQNSEAVRLPAPNPFIPKELKLVGSQEDQDNTLVPKPKVILDQKEAKIYFVQDHRYKTPQVYWYFEIKTPQIIEGKALRVVFGDLYVKALNDALNKYAYNASLAGLDYKIERIDNGIGIRIQGYSENAAILFHEILKQLKELNPTEEQFELYKQSLLRQYQNFSRETPLKQAMEQFKSTVYLTYTTEKKKAFTIRKMTYDKFMSNLTGVFNETYIQGLFYGNLLEQQARELSQKLVSTISGAPYIEKERYRPEAIVLPSRGGPFFLESRTKSKGNAVILAVEYPEFSFKARAAQQILMQAMNEPFFSDLRTKQQTAYIVYSDGTEIENKLFNFFAVQSNTHEVRDLLARFELFIERFLQEIDHELSKERFETIKSSLLVNLEKPQNSLEDMGDLLKVLAFKYDGDFQRLEQRIQAMRALSYEEFLNISRDWMGKRNHRRLAILIKGAISEDNVFDYKGVQNVQQLKQLSEFKPR